MIKKIKNFFLLLVIFLFTSYVLAQEVIEIYPLNIKNDKSELNKIIKNKIKNLKQETQSKIEEIKEEIIVPKKVRQCLSQDIEKINNIIRVEKLNLVKNYQEKLKSTTSEDEKKNIRKEYLNKIKEINQELSEKIKEAKSNCYQKINFSTSTQ